MAEIIHRMAVSAVVGTQADPQTEAVARICIQGNDDKGSIGQKISEVNFHSYTP